MNNKRFFSFSLVVILVMLFSAVMPATVFADDGTTPVEEPVVDTPVTEEPVSVPEILEAAPEKTEVVVVSESGEVLPLASEAAAQTVIAGDPMWCPEGKLPGDPTCTSAFATFTGEGGLLTALQVNQDLYSGAGTIYIASDYDAVTAGDTGNKYLFYENFALTDLTLQGGWDFNQNKKVGTSTLAFGQWAGLGFFDWGPHSLQLKDINVISADVQTPASGLYVASVNTISSANVTLDQVAVTDTSEGIILSNDGDVTLQKVTSTGNYYGVAVSNNGSGSKNVKIDDSTFDKNVYGLITQGNINLTVTNSQANQNEYTGIYAFNQNGTVTLDGVTVNENKEYGTDLYVSNGDINITGGTYNMNASSGIRAIADGGNVTATNVTSIGNGYSGAYFYGDSLIKVQCGEYTGNEDYGLDVETPGNTDVYGADLSGNTAGEIYTWSGTTTVIAYDCNPEKDKSVAQPLYILIPQKLEELPASIPNGLTFAFASKAVILSGADTLDIPITLSFQVPADKKDANMVILWWTGTEWIKLANAAGNGRVVFDPGHLNGEFFQGQVNFDGFFVLAYK